MKIHTLTIVGVGLIGSSIGLAARRRKLAEWIIGVGRRRGSPQLAKQLGAIDEATGNLVEGVKVADFVVICTPVDILAEQIEQAAPHCPPGAILTDAGSTKAAIVRALEGKLPDHVRFVGSHPVAGSEKKGPEHAAANLFHGKPAIVTPTENSDAFAVEEIREFWQALGMRVYSMSPEQHDAAMAVVSHLPHLLASALAGMLPDHLRDLTGSGFLDTTRIAAGDPSIWTGIFQQNKSAVLEALKFLNVRLDEFRLALENNDKVTLDNLLAQGKKVRDALGS